MAGVVVGVTLQALLSRFGESAKAKSTLRMQAYVDYIACLADSAHVQPERLPEIFARAANAKTRISIYGSAPVLTALAEFEKAGGAVQSEAQRAAMVVLVSAMREDGAGKGRLAVAEDVLMPIPFKPVQPCPP